MRATLRPLFPAVRRSSAVAAGLFCLVLPVCAANIQLLPVADGTLFAVEPDRANGAGAHLFIGTIASGDPRRALLRFDLSGIPPGSIITSASLRILVDRAAIGSSLDDTATLHRLLADWGEGASNSGGGGGGDVARAGDATWTQRFYAASPPQPWSTPGGDFAAGGASIPLTAIGSHTWANDPGMLADLQAWIDVPSSNHGWLIRGNEASSQNAKRMISREGGNGPLLTLQYELPVAPSGDVPLPGWALGALAAALLGSAAGSRRRRSAGRADTDR
jgi:hypothetical protein